ncbi:YceI family protein [Rhodanobacter sp. Col0626]|uniref:YceI family protein n=1 Tax=Rhodanobacter sp. Col0626 TaxID=3415679 RepID=UPI003CEF98C2
MTPTTIHAINSDPTAIRPGDYIPDPLHSHVLFEVSHFGLSTYIGEFTELTGTLRLDPARFADARLKVTVPVASVRTSSSVLDEELKGPRWLDGETYPAVTFEAVSVEPRMDGSLLVSGHLSLHGITREVALVARFHGSGINPVKQAYTVGFDVSGSIRRSDFGVSASLPLIGDELKLVISVAFELQEPLA